MKRRRLTMKAASTITIAGAPWATICAAASIEAPA
jgi:hypothetical protein